MVWLLGIKILIQYYFDCFGCDSDVKESKNKKRLPGGSLNEL